MHTLTVGIAQIAPILLDRDATLARVESLVAEAGRAGCGLVCFGEGLVPGYPFWLSAMHGSAFDDPVQKAIHARYLAEAVDVEAGHLDGVRAAAETHGVAVYLGIVERPRDRGGYSLYCSLVHIRADGAIASVHRKLQPTYEERLAWGPGDGHGLRAHACGPFRVGGLNCWENWMPLARASLYALGVDLHVAVWPGAVRNTVDVTRFIAAESRSFVVSASGLMRAADVAADFPHREAFLAAAPAVMADGGSCVAGPDGRWVLAPQAGSEGLLAVELDARRVREERQSFDPSGHYARPDVTQLTVDRTRGAVARFAGG